MSTQARRTQRTRQTRRVRRARGVAPPPRATRPVKTKLTKEQKLLRAAQKYGPMAAQVAGSYFRRLITGFGDYKIHGNSIMGLEPPEIRNTNAGMIIRHREFLTDITSATSFTLSSYSINPGLTGSFPWLSQVAQSFEQYRFRGIVYEFKTMSSDVILSSSTSTALGSVVMATQYDVYDPPFANKYTMENYQFANSSKPSVTFLHPVECARKQQPLEMLYVRGGGGATGGDLRLYDLGIFNLAAVGMQAATGVIGELWVTYEIELFKPKLNESTGSEVLTSHYASNNTAITTPFINMIQRVGSTLNLQVTANQFQFPVGISTGQYLVYYGIYGTSAALTRPTITYSNCALVPILDNNSFGLIDNTGTTATTYYNISIIKLTGSSAVVTYAGGSGPVADRKSVV